MKVNTTISFTVRVYGSDRDVTYTTTYPDLIIGGIPKRGKSNTFTDKTVKGGGSVLTLTASSSTQPGTATITAVCSGGSAAFDIQIVAA
ncbi:hypothetical protein HR12_48100 [Microbacterium sp. SUBG005]|nr:hypothetical protein HR12_48100 [Microbacterium sp. SUBG005]